MRGGAQALLVRDTEGKAYIAKCVGNPQGTRTLINEWIVSRLLRHLQISTPEVRPLRLQRGIPGDELLEFHVGDRKIPIENGIHFGSACPVDPDRKAIFDFLPRRLLNSVLNLPDLILSFAFDKWVNQVDTRQAIFIRERCTGQAAKFRAYLIDHGLSFGGSRWEFSDTARSALYFDRSLYAGSATQGDFEAIIDRIQKLPQETLFSIEREIPAEWLARGDRQEVSRLLELLDDRRTKLHETVERALRELGESGIYVPKASEARRLLGALLLFCCLPRTVSPGKSTAPVEVAMNRAVQSFDSVATLDNPEARSNDVLTPSGS